MTPEGLMLVLLTTTEPPMPEEEAKAVIALVPERILSYAVRHKETCIRLAMDLKKTRSDILWSAAS